MASIIAVSPHFVASIAAAARLATIRFLRDSIKIMAQSTLRRRQAILHQGPLLLEKVDEFERNI
jgi:hypothetical protein